MPPTPLHLGLGILTCKALPRMGCGAIIAGSILPDIEPGTVILLGLASRHHGPLHTVLAALLLGWAAGVLGWLVWSRLGLPLGAGGIVWAGAGGVAGWLGHVLLDSPLYRDITPFWPVTGENPLYMALGGRTVWAVWLASTILTIWGLAWLLARVRSQ